MSTTTLAALCARVRPELACLGDAGGPLVALVSVVERAGAERSSDVLADPGFALEVLTAAGPGADADLVGRVMDFLRTRSIDPGDLSSVRVSSAVRLADAVASYEAGGLALMDNGTIRTYRTWIRRLVDRHPDADPRQVTAGDLTDLIAHHVVAARRRDSGRRTGLCAQEHAVHAYRHMWRYFVQKGWADENVARDLTKPPRPDSRRRDIRPDEAVLVRHLAISTSRDPLLDEVTLTIPERLGLRGVELRRLRLCDLDLDQHLVEVRGKLDKERTMPIPPGLAALLERYVEDRRPVGMSLEAWFFFVASAAMHLRGRTRTTLVVTPILATSGAVFFSSDPLLPSGWQFLYSLYWLIVMVVYSGILYGVVRLVRALDELYATRVELAERVVGDERSRLSRDLHDVLGQGLTAVSLKGDLALALLPSDRAAAEEEIRSLTAIARDLLHDTRRVTRGQHTVSLDGEAARAGQLLDAAGIEAHIDIAVADLPPPVEEVLAWATREGVTNMLRHSQVNRCSITAARDDGVVWFEIVNDGAGPITDDSGRGLAGLAERSRALAGSLSAERRPDGQFALRIEVPEVHEVTV